MRGPTYLPLTFDKSWLHSVVECRGELTAVIELTAFLDCPGATNAIVADGMNARLVSVEYESK
jgi:hypothetical protein